jgi:glutathione peroxidase
MRIMRFPSNDFLKQEPGTEKEIQAFCEKNYGVEFLMMSKVAVKGNEKHPVYQWLTEKAKNGVQDSKVSWNFQKYMISENGELLEFLIIVNVKH